MHFGVSFEFEIFMSLPFLHFSVHGEDRRRHPIRGLGLFGNRNFKGLGFKQFKFPEIKVSEKQQIEDFLLQLES